MIQAHQTAVKLKVPFFTLNSLTEKTKRVWVVFHGYGQLAQYFLRKFSGLDADENFIIAPQGLSKFYLEGFSGRVGATWMTREDRLTEIVNQHAYLDQILDEVGVDHNEKELVYFGFSQGVATMARYAAHAKLPFAEMILWAGSFPPELEAGDFDFLSGTERIRYYTGNADPFFKTGMDEEQKKIIRSTMGMDPEITFFEGKHEVKTDLVTALV